MISKLSWELLGIEDTCWVVCGREDMPCFSIWWINLGSLRAVVNNLFIVFIFDFEGLSVDFKVFKLPGCQFLVTLADNFIIDIFYIRQDTFQLLRSVFKGFFGTRIALIVKLIGYCNFNFSHVVGKFLLLLSNNKHRCTLFTLFNLQSFRAPLKFILERD